MLLFLIVIKNSLFLVTVSEMVLGAQLEHGHSETESVILLGVELLVFDLTSDFFVELRAHVEVSFVDEVVLLYTNCVGEVFEPVQNLMISSFFVFSDVKRPEISVFEVFGV